MHYQGCININQDPQKLVNSYNSQFRWCEGVHPIWPLSRQGLDPVKLAYNKPVCQQSWYRADCYAELAISSLVVAETIASAHCTNPQRDAQAQWVLVAWKILERQTRKRWSPITNWDRRTLTLLMWPMSLPYSKPATIVTKKIQTNCPRILQVDFSRTYYKTRSQGHNMQGQCQGIELWGQDNRLASRHLEAKATSTRSQSPTTQSPTKWTNWSNSTRQRLLGSWLVCLVNKIWVVSPTYKVYNKFLWRIQIYVVRNLNFRESGFALWRTFEL